MKIQNNGNPGSLSPAQSTGSSFPSSSPISAQKIREMRTTFEQESQHMQNVLGADQHQTMLVAMYEGTENLVNKPVSDFDVVGYLESLKLTAQELHNRGVSLHEFRSEMLRQSQDSVFNLLKSI